MSFRVPYVDLPLDQAPLKQRLLKAVEQVLDHGIFILGPEVEAFEQRFAQYCGARYAVGVSSGTAALYLSLKCLGIGRGDEVITAPNSFVATAAAIALTGASPVFADVRDDFNLDPDLISPVITPRTRAIMPVHLTGRPADMDAIMKVADGRGLHVIEDAAQAVGAEYRGRRAGTFGSAGCFSFHPLKTLSAAGDGGMVTTDDAELREQLKTARNHGLRTRDECEFWSTNARLDTIQAAMLLVKMEYLEEWTEARRAHAAFYRERLRDVVTVPEEGPHERAVYHTFVIQADRRDGLLEHLAAQGVDTRVHYPVPIHMQKPAAARSGEPLRFPVCERQAGRILSIPVYAGLTPEQREHVAEAIRAFYRS